MKTRLGIFAAALLLLPYAGLLLSGGEWGEVSAAALPANGEIAATVFIALALLCCLLLANLIVTLRTGNNPLRVQRNYFLAVGAASSALGWLLVYLNRYAASWSTTQDGTFIQILFDSALFALTAPAVLCIRALLGSSAVLLKRLAQAMSLPAPSPETAAFGLIPPVVLGLLGGAAWPAQLFWLMWLAPLLLLVVLQLLWHESTIFSGLKYGDWGRVTCAALAGLIVGNLAVYGYRAAGGGLFLDLPNPLFAQLGFALFGLLCLQLGDVIAEQWRGKTRPPRRKPFPIPVKVKK